MEQATLKQLSEILKISISTVSRALKNHPDISEETKRKVKELAETLEYEPNSHAISLRNNSSNILGIMVPSLDNFFYDSFTVAVEEEARSKGYSVMIMQSGESKDIETANLKLLKNNRIAGVFVSITGETEDLNPFLKLQEKKVPVIFFDRVPDYEQCNKICLADRAAATMAADALIDKQKKHVLALFGHPKLTISQKRFAAFNETFKSRSPATQIDNHFPLTIAEAKSISLEALENKKKPDAIFCMGDLILIGVMHAVHEKGLRVPEDVAVVSISNGLIPTLYNPHITFVETSGYKLGKLAFKRMMECFAGSTFMQELTVDSILVEGGSL
ncbi:LacI family DNA-binding transcriptional regulator [Ferruginibacter sp. SUN106]|uniref:LacI family DNA-binding transcriptional regulator n=1 Tax=Ferruginibacter sp. SUN106 TaxID=2978348 RepID=UPI003D35C012